MNSHSWFMDYWSIIYLLLAGILLSFSYIICFSTGIPLLSLIFHSSYKYSIFLFLYSLIYSLGYSSILILQVNLSSIHNIGILFIPLAYFSRNLFSFGILVSWFYDYSSSILSRQEQERKYHQMPILQFLSQIHFHLSFRFLLQISILQGSLVSSA